MQSRFLAVNVSNITFFLNYINWLRPGHSLSLTSPPTQPPSPLAHPAACALIPVTNLPPPPPPYGGSFPQPLLFNTLQVRSALGAAQRRKLSFKNVSNVVVQLLHSIKYSMEVPFSNMALQTEMKATNTRKVSVY